MKKQALVYGIGLNDADYVVKPIINGKEAACPFYQTWKGMLRRCYSPKHQAKYPTYIGCAVTKEWLTFSNFKKWADKQDWQGKHLDKDIIKPGNKIYGPDNCVFVTGEINLLLIDSESRRGNYPVGVYFHKPSDKFMARLRKHGRNHFIGRFTTPKSASAAYIAAKVAHITDVASTQLPNVKAGLLKHAAILEAHHA